MTRSSRQRRARAARIQPAADDDLARARLLQLIQNSLPVVPNMNDQLHQSEINETFQSGQYSNSNVQNNTITFLQAQEQELLQNLEVFDVLLADPCLSELELNEILSQQAECFHQLELFRHQQEEEFGQQELLQQEEYPHGFLVEEEYYHQEELEDHQLDEQIREIDQFEAMQERGRFGATAMVQHTVTERRARDVPVIRPTNRNKSFKGHILNPNIDETDDSTNTNTSSTPVSSPGSSTTILSADFGDDDVIPIEESSCVICCVDYQHGDEIVRNANCCNGSSHNSNNSQGGSVATVSCNHVFHNTCITSWILSSGKSDCPCCRSPFALAVPDS